VIVTDPVRITHKALEPRAGTERGTILNMWDGSLVFANNGSWEMYDYIEPSVEQIKDMLDRDGKASSLESALTLPVRSAGWSIKPTKGSEAIAEEVTDKLTRPATEGGMRSPMQLVVSQMTSAWSYRRAYFEKVWKRDGNGVTYDTLAWRPPESCILKRDPDNGSLRGFKQWKWNQTDLVDFDAPYYFVYIHGQHREPVRGLSDLRVVYRNYELKQKIKFLWFTFLESLSLPRILVKGTSPENAKLAATAIAALRSAGVAGVPSNWMEGEPLPIDVGGQGAAEYMNCVQWLDSDSANSVLAGFTELSTNASGQGAGSFALSKNDTDFFKSQLSGYTKEMDHDITGNIIRDLVYYNHGTDTPVPSFEIGALSEEDVQTSLTLLNSIATATQVNLPDAFVEDLVMEVGRYLNMDLDKISRSIEEKRVQLEKQATDQRELEMAKIKSTVDVGVKAAQQAKGASATKAPSGSGAK
jgi:hypothetical protein